MTDYKFQILKYKTYKFQIDNYKTNEERQSNKMN